MTRLLQTLEASKPANRHQRRVEELRLMPPSERIPAIEADLKSFPKEVSDENVFHYKTLLRMWDSARIEARIVTPMDVQRENSPFTFEEMAEANLVFRPRLRA